MVQRHWKSSLQEKSTINNNVAGKFPGLKSACNHIFDTLRVSPKRDAKKSSPRYFLDTMMKTTDRERIVKAARSEREIIYNEASLSFTADLSQATIQAQRQWRYLMKKKQQNE